MIKRNLHNLSIILVACLFLNMTASLAKDNSAAVPKNLPKFVFGSWTINKVDAEGGHSSQDAHLDKTAVGKTFIILKDSISFDPQLSWMGHNCEHPAYKVELGSMHRKTDKEGQNPYEKVH